MVSTAEPVELVGPPPRYVSRGGIKLEFAIEKFGFPVEGQICLDAGSSTGGFTDCLLQHGAESVYAIDVGRGQLDLSIRRDPRVIVLEGVNARSLTIDDIPVSPGLVVADLSFIGLAKVAPALSKVARSDADFVFLVKPQFEAGPSRVGRGGVISDITVHRAVLEEVLADLCTTGLVPISLAPSPIKGRAGNIEFLGRWRRAEAVGASPTDGEIVRLIDQAINSVEYRTATSG